MAWERRKRGPKSGYYYLSVRTPEGVRKVYYGRRTAANLTAGVIESRKEARRAAKLANATGPVDEPGGVGSPQRPQSGCGSFRGQPKPSDS